MNIFVTRRNQIEDIRASGYPDTHYSGSSKFVEASGSGKSLSLKMHWANWLWVSLAALI